MKINSIYIIAGMSLILMPAFILARLKTRSSKEKTAKLTAALDKMTQDMENKIKKIGMQDQKLAAIFNSMIEGIIIVDKEGRIISINPTIEKTFGISKRDAEGSMFLELIRNNDISELINSVLRQARPTSAELALVYPVQRVFEVNATPVFDNANVAGCLVVIHDITEMRRLETVRSDFVANVSHELKTPLTSIKGFVETLLEGALNDKENNRNFLEIIEVHTERLNKLVDDLLSLSHLESQEIRLEKEKFNLRHELDNLIYGFRSQLKKNSIELKNDVSETIVLNADKDRLTQVLTNLIDNAIKFNKANGYIKVYTHRVSDQIKVVIEDSGIGIPLKDVPRIFERFYRVDKARSRELGGTGLGLSIVKHIVELHQGTIGVESIEGFGSKFWFTIPI